MTKRDIVLQTLAHKKPDKLPYRLSLTDLTEKKMIEYTGDPDFFAHTGPYLAEERNESFTDFGNGKFKDMFGVIWDKGTQEGDFGVVNFAPLENEDDFSNYTFPEPNKKLIREKCERLEKQSDLFRMYTIGFSLFERAWTLRGMENVLCDMLLDPDYVKELLNKIVEYNLAVIDIVSEYDIDCIFFGDDWGQQKGLIMGLPHWKEFILPCLEKEYSYVKSKGMFIAQHSCGDCVETFPYLVEMGLDIYNTFQPEVYDIEYCKKTFGDKLTFYGGISTQTLLPFATPDELEKEIERIISVLEKDGGYILAPTHAMPGDIPPENVMRFLEVARRHG